MPTKVKYFDTKAIVCISAGKNHSAAVSVVGFSYAWGNNNFGQIGEPKEKEYGLPLMIKSLVGVGVSIVNASVNKLSLLGSDNAHTKSKDYEEWKQKVICEEGKYLKKYNNK